MLRLFLPTSTPIPIPVKVPFVRQRLLFAGMKHPGGCGRHSEQRAGPLPRLRTGKQQF